MPKMMALAGQSAPYLYVTDMAEGRPLFLQDNPASTLYCCAFSPDGTLLVIGHSGSPYITIYNTADWSKRPSLSQLPSGTPYGLAFSADGSKLAVAHDTSPFVTIYNTADWTKLPNPSQLPPSGGGRSVSFSPDGAKLAVGHFSSPYVTIYNTEDWTKIANPAQLPTGTVYGVAFSPDGAKLIVAHDSSPYFTIYNTADWTKVANPAQLPGGHSTACAISPDGSKFAVTSSSAPYLSIYSTASWTKLTNPSQLPAGASYGCAFSPDGGALAVTSVKGSATHALRLYNTDNWESLPLTDVALTITEATLRAVAFIASPKRVLRGIVRDVDGYPVSRTVRAYVRSTGRICGSTQSSAADGSYELAVYEGDVDYDVQFMIHPGENLNDLFFARAIAGAP